MVSCGVCFPNGSLFAPRKRGARLPCSSAHITTGLDFHIWDTFRARLAPAPDCCCCCYTSLLDAFFFTRLYYRTGSSTTAGFPLFFETNRWIGLLPTLEKMCLCNEGSCRSLSIFPSISVASFKPSCYISHSAFWSPSDRDLVNLNRAPLWHLSAPATVITITASSSSSLPAECKSYYAASSVLYLDPPHRSWWAIPDFLFVSYWTLSVSVDCVWEQ